MIVAPSAIGAGTEIGRATSCNTARLSHDPGAPHSRPTEIELDRHISLAAICEGRAQNGYPWIHARLSLKGRS